MFNYYLDVLKKYATFSGRARRSEYWYYTLMNVIISVLISAIFGLIISMKTASIIQNIYSIATLVPSLAAAVRRMHDIGKSGWFILIPLYNLYLLCQDSQFGENGYGPNPKGIGNQETDNDLIQSIGQ
jgi:uncharacterized membrane protein YhaH (DUF805 family)